MAKLHLGVEEIVYEYDPKKSTAKVARILEERYQLFSEFWDYAQRDVTEAITREVALDLESIMAKRPRSGNKRYAGIAPVIEKRFRQFLDRYEAEKIGLPGTPTKAALSGIRHIGRTKTKGHRRPSFKDTSLIRDSFRAWVSR